MHPFFETQNQANEAILGIAVDGRTTLHSANLWSSDVGCLLGVPRRSLNIVGATRGAFVGQISLFVRNQFCQHTTS